MRKDRMQNLKNRFNILTSLALASLSLLNAQGCSTLGTWFGTNQNHPSKPISNPFEGYKAKRSNNENMVLRTRKGDRSVEVEIPGSTQNLSDFVLPVSPAFKETQRDPASAYAVDESRPPRPASMSDREITQSLSKGTPEAIAKREEIEQSLHLTEDEGTSNAQTPSYLESVDRIKQLYRAGRFEAALLEVDDHLKIFPTDAKLYEMRGTLLDRLGKRDLALRSWNQALRLDNRNIKLKRYIEKIQAKTPVETSP